MEQGMRLDPRNPARYLQNLGLGLSLRTGQCEKAIAPLKQVLVSPLLLSPAA